MMWLLDDASMWLVAVICMILAIIPLILCLWLIGGEQGMLTYYILSSIVMALSFIYSITRG